MKTRSLTYIKRIFKTIFLGNVVFSLRWSKTSVCCWGHFWASGQLTGLWTTTLHSFNEPTFTWPIIDLFTSQPNIGISNWNFLFRADFFPTWPLFSSTLWARNRIFGSCSIDFVSLGHFFPRHFAHGIESSDPALSILFHGFSSIVDVNPSKSAPVDPGSHFSY